MKTKLYSAIIASLMFPVCASAQASADGTPQWLLGHVHRTLDYGGMVPVKETDIYYTYDEDGALRQTHTVDANDDGTYDHTNEWWWEVLGERCASRKIESHNSSPTSFISGITQETRMKTSKVYDMVTTVVKVDEALHLNGSQTPTEANHREYTYDGTGRIAKYTLNFLQYDTDGNTASDRPIEVRTYEYNSAGRLSRYQKTQYAYYGVSSDDAGTPTVTTVTTYSDFGYSQAQKCDAPENVASRKWDEWLFGPDSGLASCDVNEDVDDKREGGKETSQVWMIVCSQTSPDDFARWHMVTDKRGADGTYQEVTRKTTDALGSYTIDDCTYETDDSTTPAAKKLKWRTLTERTYTSAYDYTETCKQNTDADGSLALVQSEVQKSTTDPTYGVLTRLERVQTMHDGDTSMAITITETYDGYHDLDGNTAISTAQACGSTDGTTRVYNMQGAQVGTSTTGLPHGIYIVRQGGVSRKVAK